MANETPVTVVEGPKGKAEVYEIWPPGTSVKYEVRFGKELSTYDSLGEAYIEAGVKAGKAT
jgi:hypothetical protein